MNNKNAISYFASFNNGTKDGFYVSNNAKNHFNLGTDLGNHKYEPEDEYHWEVLCWHCLHYRCCRWSFRTVTHCCCRRTSWWRSRRYRARSRSGAGGTRGGGPWRPRGPAGSSPASPGWSRSWAFPRVLDANTGTWGRTEDLGSSWEAPIYLNKTIYFFYFLENKYSSVRIEMDWFHYSITETLSWKSIWILHLIVQIPITGDKVEMSKN